MRAPAYCTEARLTGDDTGARWAPYTSELKHWDTVLQLELAEHTALLAAGFTWVSEDNQDIRWEAPRYWRGSQQSYESRSHAINSLKKYKLGIGKDRNYGKGEYK